MKATDQAAYFRRFGTAMLGYAVALFVSIWLLRQMGDSPWRLAVAVLPVVPVVFAIQAIVRGLSRMDEMHQAIQLQALAFACGLTAQVTLTLGFLENAGLPRLSWIWVVPIISLSWGLGLVLAERKYR